MIERAHITGIVIAGGKASRMGGGVKALLPLGQTTVLQAIVDRFSPQVGDIAINSNAAAEAFSHFDLPVFSDGETNNEGPLAGILSSMLWAKGQRPRATHIATVASDSPFFPTDLVRKLVAGAPDSNTVVMAKSGGYNHPLFALWPVCLAGNLEAWLSQTDTLKVMAWVKTVPHQLVNFQVPQGTDPFFNINTPDDLHQANQLLGGTTL